MKSMDKKAILETDISQHHLLNPGGRNGGKESITTNPIYSEAEELKTPPETKIVIIGIINNVLEQSREVEVSFCTVRADLFVKSKKRW
jgi:hypothetical protein